MGAVGAGAALSFRQTLERHLDAIARRDLPALADTVAPESLVLITAEGKLVRGTREFLEMHRAWFASPGWTLEVAPEEIYEGPELGVAVLRLLYQEPGVRAASLLTLVFRRIGGKWLMVQDQNTPIK